MSNDNILFISHSEKDSKMVSYFVELLYKIGLKKNDMFCSSISEIGIPVKEDIYSYLRTLLDYDSIIPIFILSENYYNSVACLNEMGAVWIKQKDYFTFLLPDFDFNQIQGAINPNKKAIKLDEDPYRLMTELSKFKDEICNLFNLEAINSIKWERDRNEFIDAIREYSTNIRIDIKECEGYCINEVNYGGCDVHVDEILHKVIVKYDFSKTSAELCSLVFFTGGINIQRHFRLNKNLQFYLRADNNIGKLNIEMHLNNRNLSIPISLSTNWEKYIIPLRRFGGAETEWANFKELAFVACKNLVQNGTVEIKDIEIGN